MTVAPSHLTAGVHLAPRTFSAATAAAVATAATHVSSIRRT